MPCPTLRSPPLVAAGAVFTWVKSQRKSRGSSQRKSTGNIGFGLEGEAGRRKAVAGSRAADRFDRCDQPGPPEHSHHNAECQDGERTTILDTNRQGWPHASKQAQCHELTRYRDMYPAECTGAPPSGCYWSFSIYRPLNMSHTHHTKGVAMDRSLAWSSVPDCTRALGAGRGFATYGEWRSEGRMSPEWMWIERDHECV